MREIFDPNEFYFVPLGGSEEFGCNLNLYVSDGKFLVVDCGIGFADERFPGIDLLLPDPRFLEDNRDDVVGIVITHAHEDHIGALPYLWQRLGAKIYCTEFTAAVLRRKFEQHGVRDAEIVIIDPHSSCTIENFDVKGIPVSHSVPGSVALEVSTRHGLVMHSGDWNLDPAPIVGERTKAEDFKAIGEKGVLAYVGDSTNSGVDGVSGSETDVARGLAAEFQGCKGKIAITVFASNIGRLVSIARAAEDVGRSVVVIGRSLHRMAACAYECGLMDNVAPFLSEDDLGQVPDDNIILVVTGSQGEYRAALARIARGDHPRASLHRGDTVFFSSRAIPGNERRINVVKNDLSAAGVNIITPNDTNNTIHVSGHPCKDEITEMIQWLRPGCVVPVHGERLQIDSHAALAEECQVNHICTPKNGSVIRLAPGEPTIIDHIETSNLAVDLKRIIPVTHQSITARRKLQYSGAVHASFVLDRNLELVGDVKITTVGLSCAIEDDCLKDELSAHIQSGLCKLEDDIVYDEDEVAEKIRISLRRFVSDLLGLRPKTTVHTTIIDI